MERARAQEKIRDYIRGRKGKERRCEIEGKGRKEREGRSDEPFRGLRSCKEKRKTEKWERVRECDGRTERTKGS